MSYSCVYLKLNVQFKNVKQIDFGFKSTKVVNKQILIS